MKRKGHMKVGEWVRARRKEADRLLGLGSIAEMDRCGLTGKRIAWVAFRGAQQVFYTEDLRRVER